MSDGRVADPDPFDPATLRANASTPEVAVERVLSAVPVRRPGRSEFYRVHPSEDFCCDAAVLEHESDKGAEMYLVDVSLHQHEAVVNDLRTVRLFTCVNKHGNVFLWPAKLPRADTDMGRRWAETALDAAEDAKKVWVKMWGNRNLGGYERARAKGDLGEPEWPDKAMRDLIEMAFRNNYINREDHPVILEREGQI